MGACGGRFIVPTRLLLRLAEDESIPAEGGRRMDASRRPLGRQFGLSHRRTRTIEAQQCKTQLATSLSDLNARRAFHCASRLTTPAKTLGIAAATGTMRSLTGGKALACSSAAVSMR